MTLDAVATPPVFVEKPCDIATASPEVGARLRCGTVRVLRDPARLDGGHFDLAVVVKRSAEPRAGALPLLILHGGPGGHQTPYMGRGAADFVPGHDSVAFDMRGGGRTGPRFCEALPQDLLAAQRLHLQGQPADAARRAAMERCAADFKAQGLQAGDFGTERNVADAEAVRQALGLPRWLVYGMSYGTTVAAEYARRHPESLAAVVLDSPYPPDALVPPVREAQGRAIDQVLRECRADTRCAARFATLDRAGADAALQKLATSPLRFQWQGQAYQADEVTTRAALHGLFYSEVTAHTVPWFLEAVQRGDGHALTAALALPLIAGNAAQRSESSMGGLVATDCRDRPRHHAPSPDGGPSWVAVLGGMPDGACAPWPLGAEPQLPADTTVPVLVLTAAYDGFQPDGAAMARTMGSKAQAVAVPRAAHVVRGAGACPRGLVADFLRDPSRPLQLDCLNGMEARTFLLDARPLPAAALLPFQVAAGAPPAWLAFAAVGLLVWLVSGLLLPLIAWIRPRLSRRPVEVVLRERRDLSALSGQRWAVAAGALGLVGSALPVGLTALQHPTVAVFGVPPLLGHLMWALPLSVALGGLVTVQAAKARRWLVASAALGAVCLGVGLLALGIRPW